MLTAPHGLRTVLVSDLAVMLAEPCVCHGDRPAALAALEQSGTTRMPRHN
jgi:hypothetical protein